MDPMTTTAMTTAMTTTMTTTMVAISGAPVTAGDGTGPAR
jgi:hypothetical protein